MSASEQSLWKWLKRGWDEVPGNRLQYTRVENSASSGMPDVEACHLGAQVWLELKVADRPSSPETRVDFKHLRPKQVEFLHNRWLVGGRAWMLLRVDGLFKSVYLLPGRDARRVLRGMTERELSRASGVQPTAGPLDILRCASGYTLDFLR